MLVKSRTILKLKFNFLHFRLVMTTSVACQKQPMTALNMQRGVIEIHSAVMTYSTILNNVL